ncbi:hypothetical protein [Eubacterium xylanophilum]|uniref:hypothetical protein n=1 Tax=Eubacterium xylanophilum TaxID=39497 RepID=UPI00047D4E29|nr:hypothetical protein [Eubacterium xylanophilum]
MNNKFSFMRDLSTLQKILVYANLPIGLAILCLLRWNKINFHVVLYLILFAMAYIIFTALMLMSIYVKNKNNYSVIDSSQQLKHHTSWINILLAIINIIFIVLEVFFGIFDIVSHKILFFLLGFEAIYLFVTIILFDNNKTKI